MAVIPLGSSTTLCRTAIQFFGEFTLVVSKRQRVIARVPTIGYLIDAQWSPDGRYVAVNNRRGNSGDYVWVFSLKEGRAIKKPDDDSFSVPVQEIRRVCSECNDSNFDKGLTTSKGWISADTLRVETRLRYYKTALLISHALYRVSGRRIQLVKQQIERHPFDWQPPGE